MNNNNAITALQVLPVIADGNEITAQPEGPTEATTGWAAYGALKDGTVIWLADYPDESLAMGQSQLMATLLNVPIEPQHWRIVPEGQGRPVVGDYVIATRKGSSFEKNTIGKLMREGSIDSENYYFIETSTGTIGPSLEDYWTKYNKE